MDLRTSVLLAGMMTKPEIIPPEPYEKVDYNEEIKVVILGESGVGKSNIINRYNGGEFNPNSSPNNSSFFSIIFSLIKLQHNRRA